MSDTTMQKKDQILIARVTDQVKSKLAQLAQGDGVSMGEYLARLIERDAKRRLKNTHVTNVNE